MRYLWTAALFGALCLALGCPEPEDDDDDTTYHVDDDVSDDDDDTTEPDDADGDGWPASEDCDDNDASLNLDDADGDGYTTCDEDCDDGDDSLNLDDADGDGYTTCDEDCDDGDDSLNLDDEDGDGYTTCDGDCDDADDTLNLDDADTDGYTTCDGDCDDADDGQNLDDTDTDGYSTCDGDCDDADPLLNLDDADGDGASTCDGDCDDTDDTLNLTDADGDGHTTCDGDCDDADDTLNLDDADADGYTTCDGDCDDADDVLNLDDADGDGDTTCDGDCDDADAALNLDDGDGDGFSTCDDDCDDASADIYPGAAELCDGLDNDCDPATDENADGDGDGAGVCDDCDDTDPALNLADVDGDGVDTCSGDCADADSGIYPGAFEACDGVDNDCDPATSEDGDLDGDGWSLCDGDCDDADAALNLDDADADGFHSCAGDCDDADDSLNLQDADNDGVDSCSGDCDDSRPDVLPGAPELCDGLDNDCDPATLENVDDDGDGWGVCDGDCDDADLALNLDDADGDGSNTCDGDCDDGDATVEALDVDNDGVTTCDGDCDDNNLSVYPGAPELCDGLDNDCDPATDEAVDADGDSWDVCEGDCDDDDPALNLDDVDGDTYSTCDGDCDDTDPSLNLDDLDGDGYTSCDAECDDSDPDVYIGAPELCDGLDNDCDPLTDENADADGDGWILCQDCDDTDPSVGGDDQDGDGFSQCEGDCDDDDPLVFPEEVVTSGFVRDCNVWLAADTAGTEWYFHRVEQPNWVYDGSRLAMYFRTGYNQPEMSFGIYYTDDDGQNWTLDGPVFQDAIFPDIHWDGQGISNPSVVYDPTDLAAPYKMYYSAKAEYLDDVRYFGMAYSTDGLTWSRFTNPVPPFDAVKILAPGAVGEFDEEIINTPYVFLAGSDYFLAYVCRNPVDRGICLAISPDGYVFTKFDPAPGVGDDPQPMFTKGGSGDWDENSVGYPIPFSDGGTTMMLHSGRSASGVRAVGAVHAPFGLDEPLTKLYAISPVFTTAVDPGRWDYIDTYATDVLIDAGYVQLFYTGAYNDPSFGGGQVAHIGRATNVQPLITLTAPAVQPHAMLTADEVTFSGTVTDSDLLDTLYIALSSSADDSVFLSTYANAAGEWSLTAPASTFVTGLYAVTLTVYDEGGIADSTSSLLEVL